MNGLFDFGALLNPQKAAVAPGAAPKAGPSPWYQSPKFWGDMGAALASGQRGGAAMAHAMKGQQGRAGINAKLNFLQAKGAMPDELQLAAQDEGALDLMMQRALAKTPEAKKPSSLAEFEAMQKNPAYADYMRKKGAQNPVVYSQVPRTREVDTDGDGVPDKKETVLIANDGSLKALEGDFQSGAIKVINTKTDQIILDSSGKEILRIPINIANAKEQEITGQKRGERIADLPTAKLKVEEIESTVNSILTDPALDQAVGPWDGRLPSFRSDTIRFDERVRKLRSQTFLQARGALKGGGAITDYEGDKAEDALLSASQAKNERDFRAAMRDFRDSVRRMFDAYKKEAGVAEQPAARIKSIRRVGD